MTSWIKPLLAFAALFIVFGRPLSPAQQPQQMLGSERDEARKVLNSLIETYKTTFSDGSWPSAAPLEDALSYDTEANAPKPRFRISFLKETKGLSVGYVFMDRDHGPVGEISFGKGFYAESVIVDNRLKAFHSPPGVDFLAGWLGKHRNTEEAREETNGRLVIMAGLLARLNRLGESDNLVLYHRCVFKYEDINAEEREPCASFLWDLVFDASKIMRRAGSFEMIAVCRKKKCKKKDLLKLMPESMTGAIREFGEEKGLRYHVFCRLKKEFPDFTSYFPHWEKRR